MSRFTDFFNSIQAQALAAQSEQCRLGLDLDLSIEAGFSDAEVQELAEGLSSLPTNIEFKSFTLRNSSLSATQMKILAPVLKGLYISYLDLSNNQIGPEGALALAKALEKGVVKRLPFENNLSYLNLANNHIGAKGFSALEKSWNLYGSNLPIFFRIPRHLDFSGSRIVSLNLEGNLMSEELPEIWKIVGSLPLVQLNIKGAPISAELAKELAKSISHTGIVELLYDMDVNGSHAVEAKEWLGKAIHNNQEKAERLYEEGMMYIRGEPNSLGNVQHLLHSRAKPLFLDPQASTDLLMIEAIKAGKDKLVVMLDEYAVRQNYSNALVEQPGRENLNAFYYAARSDNHIIRKIFGLRASSPAQENRVQSVRTFFTHLRTSLARARLGGTSEEARPLVPREPGSSAHPH